MSKSVSDATMYGADSRHLLFSELMTQDTNGTYLRAARDFCPRILAPILSFPRCRRGRDRGKKLGTLAPSLAHEMRGGEPAFGARGPVGWGQRLK